MREEKRAIWVVCGKDCGPAIYPGNPQYTHAKCAVNSARKALGLPQKIEGVDQW